MLSWKDVMRFVKEGNPKPPRVVERSEDEWRGLLTPEQFHVTRQRGTERPFSSEMCGLFEPGDYACVCCGTPLFQAGGKFDSGTGWPSFTHPMSEDAVAYHGDASHGMVRVETTCNVCGAHLGHVFPDGPPPSGSALLHQRPGAPQREAGRLIGRAGPVRRPDSNPASRPRAPDPVPLGCALIA